MVAISSLLCDVKSEVDFGVGKSDHVAALFQQK